MKEVKRFILVDFIVLIIKLVSGYFLKSNTILASCIYDLLLIIMSLLVLKRKENNKLKLK